MNIKKRTLILATIAVLVIVSVCVWYFSGTNTTGSDDAIYMGPGLYTKSFYQDPYEFHKSLEVLYYEYKNNSISNDDINTYIDKIGRELEEADLYYDYLPLLNVTKKGEIVGAKQDDNPIGGGEGYIDIKRTGTYSVLNAAQFVSAVQKAKEGDVIFIRGNAKIDLTDYMIAQNYTIRLRDGVTLASDRGKDGSRGGMLYTTAVTSQSMIVAGENVRITGLCIQGPDSKIRDLSEINPGVGIYTDKSGLTIDNCEISGFGYTAIELKGGSDHKILNNYIHHNRNIGSGYAIHAKNAKVLIESNLFNYNRTSIIGEGEQCGLIINNNVEMGTAYDFCIKMGITDKNTDITVGDYITITNNTFATSQAPYMISAVPGSGLEVSNNYFYKSEKEYTTESLYGEKNILKSKGNFSNNVFEMKKTIKSPVTDEKYYEKHTVEMKTTNVTTRNFYGDIEKAYSGLKQLQNLIENDDVDEDTIGVTILNAIKEIEQYDRYYDFLDKTYFEVDGHIYGAVPDDSPLGGGFGYKDVFVTGDYIVETVDQFLEALEKAKSGEIIFIKGDAVIDLTSIGKTLDIKDGVTIASDRGNAGSTGALVFSDAFVTPMFNAGKDVRITGITFKGADAERRIEFHARTLLGPTALGRDVYYKLKALDCIMTVNDNLEVDNCEFSGFSHSPVFISGGLGHHIHHNNLHHNQRHGLGYGVCLDKSTALIEYNLMNWNRHDIAGTGAPGSGYEARHNVQMGVSLSHCFDMHGGRDRGDGTDIAGKYVFMHHNLFLSDEYPYSLRGTPTDLQDFYNNAVYRSLGFYTKQRLYGTAEQQTKIKVRDNLFGLGSSRTVVK